MHLQALADAHLPPQLMDQLVVRVGVPHHAIIPAVNELEADLVVITTHGYPGLKHVFLGSTAEWVVRHASCPVLTVRRRREKEFTEDRPCFTLSMVFKWDGREKCHEWG